MEIASDFFFFWNLSFTLDLMYFPNSAYKSKCGMTLFVKHTNLLTFGAMDSMSKCSDQRV